MEYSADRPINSIEEDKLGRSSFSQQLGRAIHEYRGEDSLVIGLYGGWGTGKTSILNMAVQELETLSVGDVCKPIVVKFNPWLYSSQANLINQYFNCLKNAIGKDQSENAKKTVGKALADYAGVIGAATALSEFSLYALLVKSVAQVTGKLLQKSTDLESSREKLEQALRKEKRKIVAVIDDIDRLSNSQIKDIFQMVKQVGSLPYVIYILSMDREVVQRALHEIHKCDGNEYLDKIVQIPFEIPFLNRQKLQNIFFSKFDDSIKEISDTIQLEKEYWDIIFNCCINPYINTLRDINRIINTFKFRYSLLYQETSCEDMIGITTLEVVEPKLYKWISWNKDILCDGELHNLFLSVKGQKNKEIRGNYAKEFSELGIDAEKAIRCLAALFPDFAQKIGERYHYNNEGSDIRGRMRIAQPERFGLYFRLDLEDVQVPRCIINSCIYELDDEKLKQVLLKINDEDKIIYFLQELQVLAENVPLNRIGLIVQVLLSIQHLFIGKEVFDFYILSPYHLSTNYVCALIRMLDSVNERYNVYSQAVTNASIYSLGAVAHVINLIELAYGRLAGNHEEKEQQIISLEQLQKLEKEFIDKVKQLSSDSNLITVEDFDMLFYLWSCLDKESANSFMNQGIKDDIFKLKYVCRMASMWGGSSGTGWHYGSGILHEYVSDEEIYELIKKIVKTKLDAFTELELIKLASFVLNHQNKRRNNVNVQEAEMLVAAWKKDIQ